MPLKIRQRLRHTHDIHAVCQNARTCTITKIELVCASSASYNDAIKNRVKNLAPVTVFVKTLYNTRVMIEVKARLNSQS